MCVAYHEGREVGRIPVTAPNATAYLDELTSYYKALEIKYEHDENAGFLALLHG